MGYYVDQLLELGLSGEELHRRQEVFVNLHPDLPYSSPEQVPWDDYAQFLWGGGADQAAEFDTWYSASWQDWYEDNPGFGEWADLGRYAADIYYSNGGEPPVTEPPPNWGNIDPTTGLPIEEPVTGPPWDNPGIDPTTGKPYPKAPEMYDPFAQWSRQLGGSTAGGVDLSKLLKTAIIGAAVVLGLYVLTKK